MSSENQVFVRSLTGRTLEIGISSAATTSIFQVAERIQEQTGVPTDLQRLIFSGKSLLMQLTELCRARSGPDDDIVLWDDEVFARQKVTSEGKVWELFDGTEVEFQSHRDFDGHAAVWNRLSDAKKQEFNTFRIFDKMQVEANNSRTLESFGVFNGSTMHLVMNFRGDIGVYSTGQISEAAAAVLHLNLALCPEEAKRLLAEAKAVRLTETTPSTPVRMSRGLLDEGRCRHLCDYLDRQRTENAAPFENLVDFQRALSLRELEVLLSSPDCFDKLLDFFAADSKNIQVKLRRLEATGQSLMFHTDTSKQVMQVALNENYEGGELVFLGDDGQILKPLRPTGFATVHDFTVVHGVTSLTSGVRYGLFFLLVE